jgi:hypothetical protein
VPAADADYVAALGRAHASNLHPAVIRECWKRFCRKNSVGGLLPSNWAADWRMFASDEHEAIETFKLRRRKTVTVIEQGKRATETLLAQSLTREEREAENEARRLVTWAREDARRAVSGMRLNADAEVARLDAEYREVVRKNRMAASARIVEQRREQEFEQERARRSKFERYEAGTFVGDMIRAEERQQAEVKRIRSLSIKQRETERDARQAAAMGINPEEYRAVMAAFKATIASGGTWSFDATIAELRSAGTIT